MGGGDWELLDGLGVLMCLDRKGNGWLLLDMKGNGWVAVGHEGKWVGCCWTGREMYSWDARSSPE